MGFQIEYENIVFKFLSLLYQEYPHNEFADVFEGRFIKGEEI